MEHTREGKIIAICISDKKHVPKSEVDSVSIIENYGIKGDAHAGAGHRQISMIDSGEIEQLRTRIGNLNYGSTAENLVIGGINLSSIGIGSVLKLGEEVITEVTQIGKLCNDRCSIFQSIGKCPMSSDGIFGRVLKGGQLKKGDKVTVEKCVSRETFQCAVVVVSDRCSRGITQDTAGEKLRKILMGKNINVFDKSIVPDDKDEIIKTLTFYCDEIGADMVITSGGTGMAPSDITPEATARVIEKLVPGLSEAIRMSSMKKNPRAILSRGISGIRRRTLIINLPGSERAVEECIETILDPLIHGIETLRGSIVDCGRQGNEQSK